MNKKYVTRVLLRKQYWLLPMLFVLIFLLTGFRKNGISFFPFPLQDTTNWPGSFNFGRVATSQEISKLDIDVRPDGLGLPEGSGSTIDGKKIYTAKCAACHGYGTEPVSAKLASVHLVSKESIGLGYSKVRTIGNYWPYASTVFDYIRRTMPLNAPGSLKDKEVYSLTAYILSANKVIDSSLILNKISLPKIMMPAQNLFIADDRKGGPEIK